MDDDSQIDSIFGIKQVDIEEKPIKRFLEFQELDPQTITENTNFKL